MLITAAKLSILGVCGCVATPMRRNIYWFTVTDKECANDWLIFTLFGFFDTRKLIQFKEAVILWEFFNW